MAKGRRGEEVEQAVSRFTHPENVRWVSIDWSAPYRKFAQQYFPNAKIVADTFHVLRLLSGPLIKRRRLAEQGRHNPYLRWLLLTPGYQLPHKWRQPS